MASLHEHPHIVNLDTYLDGCTCDGEHPAPLATLYSGADACRVMAQDCRAIYGDRPVLLLSDPETQAVAGEELQRFLEAENVNLTTMLLPLEPVADDVTVEKIRAISKDMALIISVGSGTISDLGKYPASEDGIDFWSMPTASLADADVEICSGDAIGGSVTINLTGAPDGALDGFFLFKGFR